MQGFMGYVPTTMDRGNELLLGTALVLLLLTLLLTCMVAVGKRKESSEEEERSPLEVFGKAVVRTQDHSVIDNDLEESSVGESLSLPDRRFRPPHNHASEVQRETKADVCQQTTRCSILPEWRHLMIISAFDDETKRLCKTSFPFVGQALLQGIMGGLRVGMIGRFIGTNALIAYLAVDLLVGLSTSLLGGFQEALSALCSHGLGHGSNTLAGQYFQIAAILYILCYIPFFVLWMSTTGAIVIWLGFDDDVRSIAEEFVLYYLYSKLVFGVHKTVRSVLNVIGRESYATVSYFGTELLNAVGLWIILIQFPTEDSLAVVGMVYVLVESIALLLNIITISCRGWFDPMVPGIVGSLALLNTRATKTLVGTASSLAVGEFLAYCEWELLTVFASFLGPAEVAAWGILGTIWNGLELITEAVANAAEVRVSFLLGSGYPDRAKLSAYKTMFLALFTTCMTSSVLFIGGKWIPALLTGDPILQRMTADVLPLLGIGNIALSFGAVSWTMIGAQGRYRLSTVIGFSGSWLVALPLACVSSMGLHLDLQGQTASLIVGSFVSAIVNTYVLFQSDWSQLSRRVIVVAEQANAANFEYVQSFSRTSERRLEPEYCGGVVHDMHETNRL